MRPMLGTLSPAQRSWSHAQPPTQNSTTLGRRQDSCALLKTVHLNVPLHQPYHELHKPMLHGQLVLGSIEIGVVLCDHQNSRLRQTLFVTWRTFDGPFSAVSTATIARVGAFFRIFRDLQDVHSFAPLQNQNFGKFRNFSRFLWFFSKFHRFSTQIWSKFLGFQRSSNFAKSGRFWKTFDEFWRKVRQKFVKSSSNFDE
jgi:hypothetical protein